MGEKNIAADVFPVIAGVDHADDYPFEGKVAIVAETAVNYGMGRMLEVISHDPGLRVFKTLEEAKKWVGVEFLDNLDRS